jgi:hypothetical protein
MDTAQYAGDDYIVKYDGLHPFDTNLEHLPWSHVESYWVYPGREETTKEADISMTHPQGTALHDDKGLANRVEDHFSNYGTSVREVADNVEHLVRTANDFNTRFGANWYEHEAGSAVGRLRRQGYSRHEAAHLIADLSPQNNWLGTKDHPELGNREEAVRYGREVSSMRQGVGKYEGHILNVSDDDANDAHSRFVNKKGESTALLVPGRYDISHPDPKQWDIDPIEMSELPQFHSRATRPTRAAGISTALRIRHTDELGPKTWPFHHNILEPHTSPYATIDTHMVDAGGVKVKQSEKGSFLSSVGGVHNERKNIPVYRGYGQVGMASAVTEVTRRLNANPESWMHGSPPLLPHHVQAISWTEHLTRKKAAFRKVMEPLYERPLDEAFGYNFGHGNAY